MATNNLCAKETDVKSTESDSSSDDSIPEAEAIKICDYCVPDVKNLNICEHVAKAIRKLQFRRYYYNKVQVPIPCGLIVYLIEHIRVYDTIGFLNKTKIWTPHDEEDSAVYLYRIGEIKDIEDEPEYTSANS